MRAVALVLGLAACDPIYAATFEVTTEDGTPIERASIALTDCSYESEVLGAQLTDADGITEFAGLGFTLPDCTITVAKPGFEPQECTFASICNGDLDDCHRVRTIFVVLEPNAR